VLVTADGALARGTIRASHRVRAFDDPPRGAPVEVTGLYEAALSVVASDLGSPWVDLDGRVVALLVGADPPAAPPAPPGAEGLEIRPEVTTAYAVPAEVVREVWPLLRWKRSVPRAALGVRTRPVSEAVAAHVCRGCGGHVVEEMAEDGPAARAGVLPFDVLHEVDGVALARGARLADVLLAYRPGASIRLGILREGRPLSLPVALGSVE
jgi:S1-C subfamily serine protease